MRYELFKHILS